MKILALFGLGGPEILLLLFAAFIIWALYLCIRPLFGYKDQPVEVKKVKPVPLTYDETVIKSLDSGWRIEAEISSGTQLKGHRKIIPTNASALLIIGVLTIPLYGLGLLFLIAAIVTYSQAPTASFFISREKPELPDIAP